MVAGKGASTNNVHFLKTDPKARYQGYKFYFREGFCWIDVNSTYLKARLKESGVFDVLSMTLFTQTQLSDKYFVALINSDIISLYVDTFINNTSHFQINDARQLPIVYPTPEVLSEIIRIVDNACLEKKQSSHSSKMEQIQINIDKLVRHIYKID